MQFRIWLPLLAAGIYLVASTAVYNLFGANTMTLIQGGAVGLVLAACLSASQQGRLGSLGRLMILVPLVALLRWVAMPLIGLSREPVLAGFDGTNPAVLVPGAMYLASFAVVYCSYALIAQRPVAAD